MALSIVSLVLAVVALSVNVSGLVRRPRIVAEWGEVQSEPPWGEGLSIIVTARRRPIEVDEVGIVLLANRPRFLRVPEWLHAERPFRVLLNVGDLPRRLEDGESVRGFMDLDSAIDEVHCLPGKAYTYVKASGTVYLASDGRLRKRLGLGHRR